MNNLEKFIDAFVQALEISPAQVTENLAYNSIKNWDSTAHMALITELERCFQVMFDTDDIIDMSSVTQAKTILKKYGVEGL